MTDAVDPTPPPRGTVEIQGTALAEPIQLTTHAALGADDKPAQDVWTVRLVVLSLAFVAVAIIGVSTALAVLGKAQVEAVTAQLGTAVGALAGILASTGSRAIAGWRRRGRNGDNEGG